MTPLLQFNVIGALPTELSLFMFMYLPAASLLTCSLVSKHWHTLTTDQVLWRCLCYAHGWEWRMDVAVPTPWDGLGDADPTDTDAVIREARDEGEGMDDEEEEDDSVDWVFMPMNIDDIEAQGLPHLLIPITSAAERTSRFSSLW
ncbi:F-box domain-containing protein [Suillus discolor]|uniref:F-box domain-containing protein n=1 Tax=Suillus discolor TaxID=1912936 RepID=A0A9P7FAB4_9AGAM|nr:F-box domain-containing protein [Suillus discolor]KAG2110902.1 F-box domain-containing protein [Suillus discolor]